MRCTSPAPALLVPMLYSSVSRARAHFYDDYQRLGVPSVLTPLRRTPRARLLPPVSPALWLRRDVVPGTGDLCRVALWSCRRFSSLSCERTPRSLAALPQYTQNLD